MLFIVTIPAAVAALLTARQFLSSRIVPGKGQGLRIYRVSYGSDLLHQGALVLEVRRWFDSGPKLHLLLMADAAMAPNGEP